MNPIHGILLAIGATAFGSVLGLHLARWIAVSCT
jgi:hypothetical protein